LLEKEKDFVYKLPKMIDPDPDEIEVILFFNMASIFSQYLPMSNSLSLRPNAMHKGKYKVSIIL
jgi:hypothetical protein